MSVRIKATTHKTPTQVDESPSKSMWMTTAVEWFEGPPADLAPIRPDLLEAIHRFDPNAYPLFVRRVFRTPEHKTVIRTNHALAYQKWTPATKKEPINVFRGTWPGKLRGFNGPLYEDRVLEWFPPWFKRRDRPGVFQPWDEIRLAEMRHQWHQLYGRIDGVEKTDRFLKGLYQTREQGEKSLVSAAEDRFDDAAGPFDVPYVGYTGKTFDAA